MKKPIIAGVLIIAILILGYFGYKKVEERTNETLKNLTPTQLKEITGEETKEKTEEVPIVEHEVVAEKKTSNSENVKKSTKKSSKNVKTTTKKNTTKKKTTTKKVAYNKTELQSYAHNLVISYGWSEYDYKCLVKLINHESSWNPNAINKKSGACGLFQALPCKKMAKYGNDYKTNYKTQMKFGFEYIKNRYKTPAKAWEFWQSHHWY